MTNDVIGETIKVHKDLDQITLECCEFENNSKEKAHQNKDIIHRTDEYNKIQDIIENNKNETGIEISENVDTSNFIENVIDIEQRGDYADDITYDDNISNVAQFGEEEINSIAEDDYTNNTTRQYNDFLTNNEFDEVETISLTQTADENMSTTAQHGDDDITQIGDDDISTTAQDADDETTTTYQPCDDNTSTTAQPGDDDMTSVTQLGDDNTSTYQPDDDNTSTTSQPGDDDNTSTYQPSADNTSTTSQPGDDDMTSVTQLGDDKIIIEEKYYEDTVMNNEEIITQTNYNNYFDNNDDIVIDGETIVDDLLMASRVAQIEQMMYKKLNNFEYINTAPTSAPTMVDITDDEEYEEDVINIKEEEKIVDNMLKEVDEKPCMKSLISPIIEEDVGIILDKNDKILKIGIVHCHVEGVLVIKSTCDMILDLGSLLCCKNRKIIGEISDTFGPIYSPFYSIYIDKININIGDDIYSVSKKSTYITDNKKVLENWLKDEIIDSCDSDEKKDIKKEDIIKPTRVRRRRIIDDKKNDNKNDKKKIIKMIKKKIVKKNKKKN
eukprot:GHVL01037601.1.p1 GENE.GHVL01037601.1~~GHVL01037601.1.p1  ORF type:complete len:554 (+),score=193.03 GHVL01037601.1:58-1719(+)